MSAKIHNFEDHAGENTYKDLIKSSKEIVKDSLSDALTKIFDEADDLLFNTAENSGSSSEQNEYFDIMRLLRIERNSISKNFIQKVQKRLATKKETKSDNFSADELSLVSQDEMEEMVAISSITNRSDNIHAEAISHLQARIEHLTLKSQDAFEKDALLPKNICEDFLSATSNIELNTNSKLILLKVFGKHIDEALQSIYETINYRFIEADILPTIKISAPKQNSQRPSISNVNDNFYSFSSTEYRAPEYSQSENMNPQDIQQTIQNYIKSSIPDNAVTQINNQNFYERSHVVNALSNLQTKFTQTAQPVNFDLIKRALLNNINNGSGGLITRQVNQVDEKTIEVIELLFDEILQDENLTSSVKTLILRLQIPVIKVAMLDQNFFSNPNHPARSFLNILSHIGIGITDDEDELLSGIEVIIDTLLNEYEQDSVSFQKALDSLNRISNKEFDSCQKNEQHTQKSILREHARKIVLAELQILAKNKNISKKNEPLVLKLWPTHMYHQYINFGKDSEQWNESVSTLKLIINSLQLPTNQKELQQLVNKQDDILQLIEDKLVESHQKLQAINLAIYALSETFLELINQADIPDPEENSFASFAMDTFSGSFNDVKDIDIDQSIIAANLEEPLLPEIEIAETTAPDKREQLQLLPKEVKPGLWFELYNGEDQPVRRLKLSVIIMEEAQLIFVNRQGVKELDKNAAEFAKELESEKSKIIADHSVFDQALNNVISVLSKSG